MADYEVSKIMWVAIVVAVAASIFVIAKPQITTLADSAFANVENVVKGIDTGDTTPSVNTHWEVTGADSTPINQDSIQDITLSTGEVVGHFSTDGSASRLTFDTEAAKSVDFNTELRLTYSGPWGPSVGSLTTKADKVLEITDGQKAQSSVVFNVGPGNIGLVVDPTEKGHSLYGVVLDWDENGNISNKVTSHYEEVPDPA